ncbi:UDP-N-acetylmuramoylalanine--D-glutamate ligase, partial [candidate division WOR-1 bacterium RIFOXYA2_FULL_37_7]
IAKKLLPLAAKIFITDNKLEHELDPLIIKELEKMAPKRGNSNLCIETGGHTLKSINGADLIVLSPGVKTDLPILKEAKLKNIPVIGEVELAYRFLSKPIIAVTGTNGKTTTTTLIGEFLKAGGKKIAVAGNIGIPLISVNDSDLDFIVVEISSYQLETIVSFRPWISVFLNLTEDHIERHGSMQSYGEFKARLFMNQKTRDYLVYNAEDAAICEMAKKSEARLIPFSKKDADQFLKIPIDQIRIKGAHNLENALAASIVAKIVGIQDSIIAQVLKLFKGVEHRIEFVAEKNGVKFYNDSKATNPESTIVALKALDQGDKSIILLLGGKDKGGDLSKMCALINQSVKHAVLFGEGAKRFEEALKKSGFFNFECAKSFDEALCLAFKVSKQGDKLLLSPACASFDMFKNFEERGNVFKSLVAKL